MSPRNSAAKRKNNTGKKAANLDGIQLAGLGVIVVIAAVAIWMFVSARGPATGTASQSDIKQWSSPPPMEIDVNKQYFANVKMQKGGEFVIQLFPDKAPITVNSFVFLAKQGFFDGVTFHRVLDGFMAQGGDPTGTGMSGPGYQFVNENNDILPVV